MARVILCAILGMVVGLSVQARENTLTSPNKALHAKVKIEKGILSYQVDYKGVPVILSSRIGFEPYMQGFDVESETPTWRSYSGTWKNPFGERSTVFDHYAGDAIRLRCKGVPLRLECRVYNEGFAFRFVIPKVEQGPVEWDIPAERTEFCFADDYTCWPVFTAQGYYAPKKISDFLPSVVNEMADTLPPPAGEPKPLKKAAILSGAERPLVVELPHCVVAIGEAGLIDFARMKFEVSKPNTFRTKLEGPAKIKLPYKMPWRYVRIADNPCRLLEGNDMLLNLNESCKLADTSWIKPGKALRCTVLSTEMAKSSVAFCKRMGLQYILFDSGWYGNEGANASDARVVNVEASRQKGPFDLPEIIRYGKEHGIGVILYVNRRELERRLDELLPLYQSWSVAGIKYGFINVGSQAWTAWTSEAIRKAGEARMMIDIHDEYRLTGNQRTYPNVLTVEGVHGNEEFPDAAHNCALAFTRYLGGPGDYTPCWQDSRVKNTRAHQLALSVVYFSPLQVLYWYDQAPLVKDVPELDFWRQIPTVWDDTKALHGQIGAFATIARCSQERWYVGSINALERRSLNIPLTFLKPNVRYTAKIYADAAPDGSNRTGVTCSTKEVTSTDVITADMAANGGHAIELIPLKRAASPSR